MDKTLGLPLPPVVRGIGLTPIPRPQRLYFWFGDPIPTVPWAGRHEDKGALREVRDEVKAAVEGGIELLLERARGGLVRAMALHEDVLVLTSRLWQTNATALRAGGECMLVDSPYFPDELEMLPGVLAQAGFRPDALLATHADYDHLLARLAFPDLPLGVGETTMERIRAQPGEAQRDLREEDARNYVTRDRPLGLGGVRSLPVPGKLELGSAR